MILPLQVLGNSAVKRILSGPRDGTDLLCHMALEFVQQSGRILDPSLERYEGADRLPLDLVLLSGRAKKVPDTFSPSAIPFPLVVPVYCDSQSPARTFEHLDLVLFCIQSQGVDIERLDQRRTGSR